MTPPFARIINNHLIFCSILVVAAMLAACSEKDDTLRVRKLIDKCARSAEQKQISDLLAIASDDFRAQPGRYDARAVKGILFATFRRYGKFEIHYPQPKVTISPDGDEADATVYFLIVRQDLAIPGLRELYQDPQGWLEAVGEKADLYQLELKWVKKEGEWLVRRAYIEGFRGFAG